MSEEELYTEPLMADALLMIKPVHFRRNDQTAVNNHFQNDVSLEPDQAQEKALAEFENLVSSLRERGVKVVVILDNDDHDTPDSIFPNNWLSFHEDGRVGLYPMFAENRRNERRADIFEFLSMQGLKVGEKVDLTAWEGKNKFLEGTGSLVLDRDNKVAYAAISDRTNLEVLEDFKNKFGYEAITFHARHNVNGKRRPIYHTNVMMAMGDSFVVVCLDAIDDEVEKHDLILSFATTGKEVIALTESQVDQFAGNMLQVANPDGKKYMVMSERAFNSLDDEQKEELHKYNDDIITAPLEVIENLGGGSARCMIAEVFTKA